MADDRLTISSIPVSQTMATQLEQLWLSDFGGRYPHTYSYYSGSQVLIYLGDFLVDEAVFVSYTLRQNKRPIYGYASAYWDTIAVGTVLVEGVLAVNYIDNKYLSMMLYDHAKRQRGSQTPSKVFLSSQDKMTYMAALSGYNLMTRSGQAAFTAAMEVLRQQYWQGEQQLKTMPRADQMPPVDIYLTYGIQHAHNLNSTTKKLEQVVFVGESQNIELGGQPILEVYNFYARRVLNVLKDSIPVQPKSMQT